MQRLRFVVAVVWVLSPAIVHATIFNVGVSSGNGQFAGKQAAAFGPTAVAADVDLTPGVPVQLPIMQFSGFDQNQVFPYSPGASTTFSQTLTVNGVSTTVTRTLTLVLTGDGCTLIQSLSPVTLTVDLGSSGKVTLALTTPPTIGFACSNGQPILTPFIIVIPGTSVPLTASLLDDFFFYTVKTTKGAAKLSPFGPVALADALDGADYDVKKLVALGKPAGPNNVVVFDETTELARYSLKRRKSSPKFAKIPDLPITNACGDLVVTAVKPESLLVPVRTDLAVQPPVPDPMTSEVDHFLCYKAKTQKKHADGTVAAVLPKHLQVDAADEFQTRRYDLKKVTRLCVPVDKSGSPLVLKTGDPHPITPTAIRHPLSNFVCYQAKPAKSTIAQTGCGPVDPKDKGTKIVPKPAKHEKRLGVLMNGQLGAATIDTAKELELCVPLTETLR